MTMGKYSKRKNLNYHFGGITIADPVMRPVIVILIGAILIAIGIIFASHMAPGVGIILGIGGVATILVGIAMLFGLAQEKK